MTFLSTLLAAALPFAFTSADAQTRDQIRIVGSSTVLPYAQAVAEEFAGKGVYRAPVVEATGTGGGLQMFCGGIGIAYPDIANASRPMTALEHETCLANGVDSITEIILGRDGLTLAHSLQGLDLSLDKAQIFQALASEIAVDGRIVPNPFTRWSQIDPSLPDVPIQVFGPPPTSGTRDAFVEMVMNEGCKAFPAIEALPEARRSEVCGRMRQDGPFIEAGENDNLIVQRLRADPTALGIFGHSFLYENSDVLKAVTIEGMSGADHLARPLFVYVKNLHRGVVPGLAAFLDELVSEDSIGPDGYLAERGLIPLSAPERALLREGVAAGTLMTRFD